MNTNIFRPTLKKAEFANQLRRSLTPAESELWKYLRNDNIGSKQKRVCPWLSQVVVKGWIIDFYNNHRLLGEVDGSIHDTQEQWEKDHLKDSVLGSLGIRIVRISNRVVLSKPIVIAGILKNYKNSNTEVIQSIAALEEFS